MYMALFVLDDPDRLDEVLAAWEKAGITGVTIFETTGMRRMRQRSMVAARFVWPVVDREVNHLTLMAIVPGEQEVDTCLREAERVVGDLSNPHAGIFAAWPLTMVKGYRGEGN